MFKDKVGKVDWVREYKKQQNIKMKLNSFGMDYGSPGQLGGLGQGYVQPNLMYFGDSFAHSLFKSMQSDKKLSLKLNNAANKENFVQFHKLLKGSN